MSGFKKAQRTAAKFKGSIQGASGSGKTMSALKIATALVAITDPGKRIAVVDTEKSASLYSPPFDFDVDDDFGEGLKASYEPQKLVEKLEAARKAGDYGAVIIDSATHFWKEQGGFTKMIDSIVERQKASGKKPDSFAAWKDIDPLYRKLMTYIRNYPLHVILCVRAKQAYEKVEGQNGKGSIKKIGVEPEFREGFEYDMDAQFAINEDHTMVALKHRLGDALKGKVFKEPGADVAELIAGWLGESHPVAAPTPAPAPTPAATPAPASDTFTIADEATPQAAVASEDRTDEFVKKLEEATTMEDLQKVAGEIRVAVKDKQVSDLGYKDKLAPVYRKRSAALKEVA